MTPPLPAADEPGADAVATSGVLDLDLAAGATDVLARVRSGLITTGVRCLVVRLGPVEDGWSDEAVLALADASVPLVAVLDGDVGGLPAAACLVADLRVASQGASLSVPALRGGTSATLPALVGAATAQALLLDPRVVEAEEALRLGLVRTVVDDAPAEAQRLAASVAREPGTGAAVRRALLATTGRAGLDRVLEEEARLRQVADLHRGDAR